MIRDFGDDRIHYLYARNGGLAAARNRALRRARGEFIAYVDDDDILYPDHLAVLTQHLKRSKAALAFTRALRVTKENHGPLWSVERAHVPWGLEVTPRLASVRNFTPVLGVMHRRRALLHTGLFDEEIFSVQDWDLWLRFVDHFDVRHIPLITAEYDQRLDASSMQGGAATEHGFHATLIQRQRRARARRLHLHARRALLQGQSRTAARFLGLAWNSGLEVESFAADVKRLARQEPSTAAALAAHGGAELAPHLPGWLALSAHAGALPKRALRSARRQLALRAAMRLRARPATSLP